MAKARVDYWAAALELLSPEDRHLLAFGGPGKLEVLTDLQDLTEKAKARSIEKRWRFRRPSRGGEIIILRDVFGKIATWVNHFKQIGDIVVQYVPAHAALPWAGVRFLLKVAISDIVMFECVVDGAETIAHSITRCAILEDVYLNHSEEITKSLQGLKDALLGLYVSILIYLSEAKRYFELSTLKRTFQAVNPNADFERLMRTMVDKQASVDRCACHIDAEKSGDITKGLKTLSTDQYGNFKPLQDILESMQGPVYRTTGQLGSIENRINDDERTRILHWLSSQPHDKHHRQISRQSLEDSGSWLLQDSLYINWRRDSYSSLLWLHGLPGTGKTCLISIVIEDIIKDYSAGQNPPPLYFYCSRNTADSDRSNSDAVFGSLLRQLSCVQPGEAFLPSLIKKYEAQGKGFDSSGLDIHDSQEIIVELTDIYPITIIVVDALDECDPETRHLLLDAFERILQESTGLVKILVSSRDDQDISQVLRKYPSLEISSEKNTSDIQTFVKLEIEKLVKKGRLLRYSRNREEMQALLFDKICRGAEGMFRWASLQLETLCKLTLDSDIRSRLGLLPPRLEQLYGEIYSELISDPGDVACSVIQSTLKWLLSAQKTLHTPEFLWAVTIELDVPSKNTTKEIILGLCRNLVIHDEDLDTFRFAHLSVREFLEKKPEFSLVSCNIMATEGCLLQIFNSADCLKGTPALKESITSALEDDSGLSMQSAAGQFLAYAIEFWAIHCRVAGQSARSGGSKLGQRFRYFMSGEPWENSIFDIWVFWTSSGLCSSKNLRREDWVIKKEDFHYLHKLLCSSANFPLRRFWVATFYEFIELVEDFLQKGKLDRERQEQALPLAMFSRQSEVYEILVANVELTWRSLYHAMRWLDYERFSNLLAKNSCILTDNGMEDALIWLRDEKKWALLMETCPDLIVTQSTLKLAANVLTLNMFKIIFARSAGQSVQEKGLVISDLGVSNLERVEKAKFLLDHDASITSEDLAWAADVHAPSAIMEHLLTHGGASQITANVMQIAAKNPHSEMLELLLLHGGEVTQELLLYATAASVLGRDTLNLLFRHGCQVSSEVLRKAAQTEEGLCFMMERADEGIISQEITYLLHVGIQRGFKTETIAQLLSRADDLVTSETMGDLLHIAINAPHQHASDLASVLLPRTNCPSVSEASFLKVINNPHCASELMSLLLDHAEENALTEDVVIYGMTSLNLDIASLLLARFDTKSIANDLLEAAVQNEHHGLGLFRMILQTTKPTEYPRIAFIQATQIQGQEIIQALEEYFGPTPMTSEDILGYIRDEAWADFLLPWMTPQLINEKILITVFANWISMHTYTVVERSLHLPITSSILEAAAQAGNSHCFMFLWNLAHVVNVPKSLVQIAAQSCPAIFEFLLDESSTDECGEEVLQSLLSGKGKAKKLLQCLLDKKIRLDVTPNVIKKASAAPLLLRAGTVELLLQQNQDLVITDDMLRMAACSGDEETLRTLHRYSGKETLSQRWLDIAALYEAVKYRKVERIQELLKSGLHPDQIGFDGHTALYEAATSPITKNVHVMRILLSAGAKPDPVVNQNTPLHHLTRESDLWEVRDKIKILVEAGASLDVKDENGRTPAMVARLGGKLREARYLERCEKEQKVAKSKREKSISIPESLMSDSEASNPQLQLQTSGPKQTEDGKEE